MGANYPNWVIESGRQRLYGIWGKMLSRCRTPTCDAFANYGGRGISVCAEWTEFRPFSEWALRNGYAPDLTIDRRDTNGNYEPANCSWVTRAAQTLNTRRTYRLEDGSPAVELARKSGVALGTFRRRVAEGWPTDLAATAPRRTRLAPKRTHCGQGHPLSGENLSSRVGVRICLACQRQRNAVFRAKRRAI